MRGGHVVVRGARIVEIVVAAVAAACALAPSAGAVLVRVGRHQIAGVMPLGARVHPRSRTASCAQAHWPQALTPGSSAITPVRCCTALARS